MTEQPGFNGAAVVSFESRLADLMVDDILRNGGRPVSGPSLREVPLTDHAEVFSFAEKLFAGKVDVLLCTTGVGTRILLEALASRAEPHRVTESLSRLTVIARGPKPARVLKEWNIPVTIMVPEPSTWVEVIEALDVNHRGVGLKGRAVAVQEYGEPNERLVQALREKGARVIQVSIYRWALPEDKAPLMNAVRQVVEGKVQVALFTNSVQVDYLMRFASEEGVEPLLKQALKRVVVASIGPLTTDALVRQGVAVDHEASHPKMGVLVEEAAQRSAELIRDKKEGISRTVTRVRPLPPDFSPQDSAAARMNSPFLQACRREPSSVTPVWIMRQAGRYLEEYRRIRQKVSFMELCKTPELAAEVTLLAAERLRVDAAILFSDILLIVEPMGFSLEYGSEGGPSITGRVTTADEVDRLSEIEPAESLAFVFDAVRLIRNSLDARLPLIGFAGAPFTLAAYALEGGGSKSFLQTKRFMYNDPGAWHALLRKISRGLVKYLNAQIGAGADAIQLFDSWVGCLGPADYRQFVLPHTKSVIDGLKPGVPVIHFGTGTAAFLKEMREAGGDVIGVDSRIELDQAWEIIGHDRGIQGNLDSALLCADRGLIRDRVKRILEQAAGRPGHIFNLGHGILPQTPQENAVALVEYVHEFSHR